MAGETDPVILENLFPGLYIEFMPPSPDHKAKEPSQELDMSPKGSKDLPGRVSSGYSIKSNNSAPPLFKNTLSSGYSKNDGNNINTEYGMGLATSNSSVFQSRFNRILPRIELNSFRNYLGFYTDFVNTSKFFIMQASYKTTILDVGFAEITFEGKTLKVGYLTKFYIARAYRKMKSSTSITLLFLDYLFRAHGQLEKVGIDILPENQSLQTDIQISGFKYERVRKVDGVKYKLYSIRKKEFYDFLESLLN